MTKQIDELMRLADEWADECAGCDGAHLAEQSTRRKTLRNALQAALVQSELWQPIETAPRDGRCMLLFYKNRINKTRRVVGSWYTDEAAAQADVDDVGLEAGWYERIDNWDEYPQAAIHEGEPTHWMPLPAEPGAPPLLTDDQIMEIAQSLGWWTVDKEIAADALRLSRAIEATVRKQFGAE